jgi:hypothetical protein
MLQFLRHGPSQRLLRRHVASGKGLRKRKNLIDFYGQREEALKDGTRARHAIFRHQKIEGGPDRQQPSTKKNREGRSVT